MNRWQKQLTDKWVNQAKPGERIFAAWESFLAEEAELRAGEEVAKALLKRPCTNCNDEGCTRCTPEADLGSEFDIMGPG